MAPLSTAAKVAIGIGLAVLLVSQTSDAGMGPHAKSAGPKVGKFTSSPGDSQSWAKQRFQAARDYLIATFGYDQPTAKEIALSVLAHWALESANGAAEYNFNFGNVHATGNQTWFEGKDTNSKGRKYWAAFVSYASPIDAIRAYFDLLKSSRYRDCAALLESSPNTADWFRCLGEKGYYAATMKGKDNLAPAAAGLLRKRAELATYAAT